MKHTLQIYEVKDDEKRVYLIRRHGFIFFRRMLLILFLSAIPVIFLFTIYPSARMAVFDRTPGGVILFIGLSAFYLYLSLYFLHAWVDYYLDVWIVSTKRIVNIEQQGLFSRIVSELFLDKVQDVTVEVHGIFATMLHYGDISIQTAGENPRFYFDDIPKPYAIADTIMKLHRQYVVDHPETAGAAEQQQQTPPAKGTQAPNAHGTKTPVR